MSVSLGREREREGRGGGRGEGGEREGRGKGERMKERMGNVPLFKVHTHRETDNSSFSPISLFPYFPLPPSLLLTSCASSSPGKVTYQQSFSAKSQLMNLGHVSFENNSCISCTRPHIVNTTDNNQQATPTSLGVSFAISLNMRTHLFSGTARTLVRVGSI